MNAEHAWQSVLGQLQMEMPRASFDTWVRDTKPVSCDAGVMTVAVRNATRVTGSIRVSRRLSAGC